MRLVLSQSSTYGFWPSEIGEQLPAWATWRWCRASSLVREIQEHYDLQWSRTELLERFVVQLWSDALPELQRRYRFCFLLAEGRERRLVHGDPASLKALEYLSNSVDPGLPAKWVEHVLHELALDVRRLTVDPLRGLIFAYDEEGTLIHPSR